MSELDSAAAMAIFSDAIVTDLVEHPDLGGSDWDTVSVLANVADNRTGLMAFRYAGDGPPIPTSPPDSYDHFEELHRQTRGGDGPSWDTAIVKFHRPSAVLDVRLLAGEEAKEWLVTPQSFDRFADALRPGPEDFAAG